MSPSAVLAGADPAAMRPGLRWALGAAVALTVAAAVWPDADGTVAATATLPTAPPAAMPGSGSTARSSGPVARPALAASHGPAGRPEPSNRDWPVLEPAAQAAWQIVPRAPAPRAAASAPVRSEPEAPPAFPYQWIGQIEEAGRPRVFIADAQRLWTLAPGETLDGQWRFESLADGRLRFTWLPGNAVVDVAARP